MLLIGLMIALSTVLFSSTLPSSKFTATARDVAATIRHARTLAQLRGEDQKVTIDMDARKYGIDNVTSREIPSGISVKIIDPLQGEVQTGQYHFNFPTIGGVEGGTIVLWDSKKNSQN